MFHINFFSSILKFSLAFILLFYPQLQLSAQPIPPKPIDRRVAHTGKTLMDCVKELKGRDGGWCKMGDTPINALLPKSPPAEIHMVPGPKSVISTWNGAAFDRQNLKMYSHGGGHRGYGGNEFYELDLQIGKWTRLTNPARIPPATKEVPCPVPVSGAPSSHTYDGIIFSRITQTIFIIPSVYGCYRGNLNLKGDLWEFNPSQSEMRNGIAPLTRRHRKKMPKGMFPKFYRRAEYPNGNLYMANGHSEWVFNPRDGTWKRIGSRPNYGAGTSVFDVSRRGIWSLHIGGVLFIKPPTIAKKLTSSGAGVDGHSGLVMSRDNKLLIWNGGGLIHTYDPEKNEWRLFNKPKYNPATKSYFELNSPDASDHSKKEVSLSGPIGWTKANVLAARRSYNGVRGRLAVVDSLQTHNFLRENFLPQLAAWIGLRYWCNFNKLQWVTGKFHKRGKFHRWGPVWNHSAKTPKDDPNQKSYCERRNNKHYFLVHYWGTQYGFFWNANGRHKEINALSIEYPTGKK